jgi:hypothetical protein
MHARTWALGHTRTDAHADDNAPPDASPSQPCVIFMDEIDAIGGRRFSEGTSADREIQRTLMELLSQLDGFDVVGKVRPRCRAVSRVRVGGGALGARGGCGADLAPLHGPGMVQSARAVAGRVRCLHSSTARALHARRSR